MPELDGETVSEMLVKVSILGIISQNPNISPENLTNHLYGFPLRSRAINAEFLNRVQTQKVIIPEEANKTLQLFRNITAPQLNKLDEYLLGKANWKGFPYNILREQVQRFIIWVLELTSEQRRMGWSV